MALQETDVSECDVVWLRAQAASSGYTLLFSDTINMATGEGMRMSRRTALLCKGPAVPAMIAPASDATCQSLLATGRWVEALIPVGDGLGHIIVASAYGYSGASSANAEYIKNETLAAHIVVRMNHNPKIPYVVGTDINVDPLDSEVLALAITNSVVYDLPCDCFPGGVPPATFLKDNVHEGM